MTLEAATPGPGPQVTRSQRWLARLSFVLLGVAVAIVVALAGLKSLLAMPVLAGADLPGRPAQSCAVPAMGARKRGNVRAGR